MSDTWIIRISLFAAGVVPFALAGGLHDDTTVWPWTAGFLTQAGFVLGMIAQRRGMVETGTARRPAVIDRERQLLEKLAAEGKATRLTHEDLLIAKALEEAGLVFLVGNTAVVTPKGRHLLAGIEIDTKPGKRPFGFTD